MVIKLFSHPRSGTAWAGACIARAFYPDKDLSRAETIWTGHWADRREIEADVAWKLRGGHGFWDGQQDCFYLVRDGRDVARSLFRTKEFLDPNWRSLSFSDFLRKPLDWRETPGKRYDGTQTIAAHWYEHVQSWLDHLGICIVRYEALLLQPEIALDKIAEFVGWEPATYDIVEEATGQFPREGGWTPGEWRDVFSEDDLAYFHSIVPENYWALWEDGECVNVDRMGE